MFRKYRLKLAIYLLNRIVNRVCDLFKEDDVKVIPPKKEGRIIYIEFYKDFNINALLWFPRRMLGFNVRFSQILRK